MAFTHSHPFQNNACDFHVTIFLKKAADGRNHCILCPSTAFLLLQYFLFSDILIVDSAFQAL